VALGPYLLAFIGYVARGLGIGLLPPHVDEAANILTSSHLETRAIIGPWALARPLLAVLSVHSRALLPGIYPY
jgi:hypothetical protein